MLDVTGRRIRTLVRGMRPAGRHQAEWDGRDERGIPVSPGLYLCRLSTAQTEESAKIVLTR